MIKRRQVGFIIAIVLILVVILAIVRIQFHLAIIPSRITSEELRDLYDLKHCPNGDYVVGGRRINVDGTMSVYNSQGFLIYSMSGWGYHSESLIYYYRILRYKDIGC